MLSELIPFSWEGTAASLTPSLTCCRAGGEPRWSMARPLPGNFTHEASHWPRNSSTQIAVISHTEENNQLLKQLSVELEELWLSRYTPRAARKDGADFR